MTDSELLEWNRKGFFPGPDEGVKAFCKRAERATAKTDEQIPAAHWDWVRHHLKELFDFSPECLPAFYSNESLAPWQGAAVWIEGGSVAAVQMREGLREGRYLGLYSREEILAHESVHAARAAFDEDRWEEYFAYMASESKWRRALGPIVERPWEVWPFVILCLAGVFFPAAFFGAALWASLGFFRLIRGHRILRRAAQQLMKTVQEARIARAILVRLTGDEIVKLSEGGQIGDESLRWRLIRLAYWKVNNGRESRS